VNLQAKRSVFRSRKAAQPKHATTADTVSSILADSIRRRTNKSVYRIKRRAAKARIELRRRGFTWEQIDGTVQAMQAALP
jgi:hypothetical protein